MQEGKLVRFDEAWAKANEFISQQSLPPGKAILVRDLLGRIRLVLDDRADGDRVLDPEGQLEIAEGLNGILGRFSPGLSSLILLASEMFLPEEVFGAQDVLWADANRKEHMILDRAVIGSDWLREPFGGARCRVTFYGVKGGVGRSTAAAVLAWRLSRSGRKVLVVDLDLESPGLGATLLPVEGAPDFGLVDWFVEDAVGQADEALLRNMVALSPLGTGGADLLVAPASGRPRVGYSYLPKLARAYAEVAEPDGSGGSFGERVNRLVLQLEQIHNPDVVLLDSRAGLHDIAAITVTRLGATCLLFATNNEQTWQAYSALFQVWKSHYDRALRFRDNLKMIAAQVPETEISSYIEIFKENSYNLFLENLYVETPPGEESEYNFDLQDSEAPHSPLRINWSRAFQQFDPVLRPDTITDEQVQAAYGDFINSIAYILFGEKLG